MKLGIFSDIHGNLSAAKAVLKDLEKQNCDKIICLGDLVGYGPYPNECIDLVKKEADVILAGNHDHAAIGYTNVMSFNVYARSSAEWTLKRLSDENREFLESLPLTHSENDVFFVHASPVKPKEWNYVLTEHKAERAFECFQEKICFIGHSHVPVVFFKNENDIAVELKETEFFANDHRYIINVGSVGQPRDRNSCACYATFDLENKFFKLFRIEYDIESTQKAMLDFDLPVFLVKRLQYGN